VRLWLPVRALLDWGTAPFERLGKKSRKLNAEIRAWKPCESRLHWFIFGLVDTKTLG